MTLRLPTTTDVARLIRYAGHPEELLAGMWLGWPPPKADIDQ